MKLSQLTLDPALQMRRSLNHFVVDEYAQAMQAGAKFPPIIVFTDGKKYYVADGFTRCAAAKQAGIEIIDVDTREGTFDEAFDYAFAKANHDNGQRYSVEDKRFAIAKALQFDRYAKKSDRQIAAIYGVSHPFVAKLRKVDNKQPDVIEVAKENGVTYELRSKKKPAADPVEEAAPQENELISELSGTIQDLAEENKKLEARVAVAAMEATDEEKAAAQSIISELQNQVKILEADNRVLKASRDSKMTELAEVKKQALYGKRRYEKAEKELEQALKEVAFWKDKALTAEAHLEISKAA